MGWHSLEAARSVSIHFPSLSVRVDSLLNVLLKGRGKIILTSRYLARNASRLRSYEC